MPRGYACSRCAPASKPPARSPEIDALAAAGELSRDVQDHLRGAFDHITGLQLRQQITDFQAGRPVSNFVDPAALTERERDLLKAGLRAINDFRIHVRAELTGELF